MEIKCMGIGRGDERRENNKWMRRGRGGGGGGGVELKEKNKDKKYNK